MRKVKRFWRFTNKNTGSDFNSNNLDFLLERIKDVYGIKHNAEMMTDIVFAGKYEAKVITEYGEELDIKIEEFKNSTLQQANR